MTNFVNSSALTKLLANVFLFLTLVVLLGIGVYDTVHGTPVPEYITSVIGAAIGYALTLLGVHVGSVTATQINQPALPLLQEPAVDQQTTVQVPRVVKP